MKIRKFFDEFLLAGKGIVLAFKEKLFWLVFILVFLLFGTLMDLLSGGFSAFELMGSVGFFGSLKIIFDAMLGLFMIGKSFLDWIGIFLVSILQATLIALIVLVAKKKRTSGENLERAGIAAGLAVLGTGCPTCGTALLTPILGAVFAGGSALIGVISWLITFAAIIILILSLKKVGEEYYVIIESEKYHKKHIKSEEL